MVRHRARMAVVVAALPLASSLSAQFGGFEIASVKPSNPNPAGPLGAAPMVAPALGRLTAMNVTLRRLVYEAYRLAPFQVVGGPAWQNTNRFDINARASDGSVTPDQILELLKTLLADRFDVHARFDRSPGAWPDDAHAVFVADTERAGWSWTKPGWPGDMTSI